MLDAILYLVRAGRAWRALPADFPPWQTVYWYFVRREQDRVTEKILPIVREQLPTAEGRNPNRAPGSSTPTASRMPTRSEAGPVATTPGKADGRTRFIVTDTPGLLLAVAVCTVGGRDRDGAKTILLATYLATAVRFIFADGGFAGRLLDRAQTFPRTSIEVVGEPAGQRGFAVIPRRRAVERTFAWPTAHRRLARDHERDPAISEAMIGWAAITTTTRRLARGGPATRQQRRTFTPAG